MSASCRSRVRFDVRTTIGGRSARTCPARGSSPTDSASTSNRNASNSSSARSISSISSTAGRGPAVADGAQQRALDEVLLGEQVVAHAVVASGLGESDRQQLARIVPLVQRLGGVDALVALEAHERRVERLGQRLGRLGLADAGLALEQDRLAQSDGAEQRGRQAGVGEVVDAVEGGAARRRSRRVGPRVTTLGYRSARRRRRAGSRSRRTSTACPSWSRCSEDSTGATVIPHTGSIAVSVLGGVASATGRPEGRGRLAITSAQIDSATSSGVRAPMSSPAGVTIRSPP